MPEPVKPQVKRGYLGSRYPDSRAYVGVIEDGTVTYELPHIEHHSPDGFEWGFSGSGPADLALAILAHVFNLTSDTIDRIPPALYQQFKDDVIATLPRDANWEFGHTDVMDWVNRHGELATGMWE